MQATAESVALAEMKATAALMRKNPPALCFTETGAGPYQQPTPEYMGLRRRLQTMKGMFPKVWEQLPAEDRAALGPIITRESLRSLSAACAEAKEGVVANG